MNRRLAPGDRYHIQAGLRHDKSYRALARELGFSASTISREIKRCAPGQYSAEAAQVQAEQFGRSRALGKYKIRGQLKKFIDNKLEGDWSPEQITHRRKRSGLKPIAFSTIYRYIERDHLSGGKLKSHLRILRRKHKDRKRSAYKPGENPLRNRVPIALRPNIVNDRTRIGDYERDLVLGKRDGPALLTIVDRTTRYVHLRLVPSRKALDIHNATVEALKGQRVNTITNDNGLEFAFHKRTAAALNTKIYFSNAFASWERGTNENTNGLVRQYLPKKKTMKGLTEARVRELEARLNSRPRKCLGWRTPAEIYLRRTAGWVLR